MSTADNNFLNKLTELIEENISNEQFGVSDLASKIAMSRSNLLRKIKKSTNLSASQFISQVRLKNAMELLKDKSYNVSEVAYQVGFNSPSYFIKCFHDFYGYPPGEVGTRDESELSEENNIEKTRSNNPRKVGFFTSFIFVAIFLVGLYIIFYSPSPKNRIPDKSIAVLPFINDSNDSTNVYVINGLMESILRKLQKIDDLRVVSRTSVEKYRNSNKSIPEIAKELNVSYFIEGSGQKLNDQILLHIQLIEASTDNHLWAEQYNRETKDIFILQNEVAKSIAEKIQVIITPEEKERINEIPTKDLVAYDLFLKGLDLLYKGGEENLKEAINYFKKAIEQDVEFARAYANTAISYYFLDMFRAEKVYSEFIRNYADKALLFDSKLPQSLIAKAVFYMNEGENELAVPYLEKALQYNPNSAIVINTLSDFYANSYPDSEKYLEYAIKGIQLDKAANDSATNSYVFLHISNAFIQNGFIEEAEKYINESLLYNPENLYSEYVKAYILYAKNKNLEQLKGKLFKTLLKDTTRLDVLQEVAKTYYYMRDFENAYKFYRPFKDAQNKYKLDIYPGENAKIGMVFSKMGKIEESEEIFDSYKAYADTDKSIYKHLSLSVYYAYRNEIEMALEHLKLFSEEDNYHYWTILFLNIDPLVDNIMDNPEYKKTMKVIENKFWKQHKEMKKNLKGKRLI